LIIHLKTKQINIQISIITLVTFQEITEIISLTIITIIIWDKFKTKIIINKQVIIIIPTIMELKIKYKGTKG
jgi:hypothetical protein